jgi:hypothetical protein
MMRALRVIHADHEALRDRGWILAVVEPVTDWWPFRMGALFEDAATGTRWRLVGGSLAGSGALETVLKLESGSGALTEGLVLTELV